MICHLHPFWLRLATTLLVALSLVMAGQVQAAMPFSGPLMAVEICHDQQVSTIWLDADGKEHPAPRECRDCALCALPAPVLPGAAKVAAPGRAHPAIMPQGGNDLSTEGQDYRFPPARGPPSNQSRIASA